MHLSKLDVSNSAGLAAMKLGINRLDVSRRWVGQQVGVSGEHIGEILSGKATPGGCLLFKLARLFDFDPSLWGTDYEGDVSAIRVVDKRGRPSEHTVGGTGGDACNDSADEPLLLEDLSTPPSQPRPEATGNSLHSRSGRRRSSSS